VVIPSVFSSSFLRVPFRFAFPVVFVLLLFLFVPTNEAYALVHGKIMGAFRLLLLGLPLLIYVLAAFLLNFISAIILAMGGLALQFAMLVTGTLKLTQGGIVDLGWLITRDIVNLFFILILVAIALATILGIEEYAVKKTLPKLLIALLLVNFSKVIIGVAVDISHIIARVFLDPVSSSNLAAQFPQSAGAFIDFVQQLWEASTTGFTELFSIGLQFIIQMLLGAVFNLFLAFILIVMALVFIARIVIIWMLVILAPLAIAAWVLPATKKHFDTWKKQLIQWIFLIIPVAFFIYLGFAFLQMGVPTFEDTLRELGPELEETLGLPGPFQDFFTVIFTLFKQFLIMITVAMLLLGGLSIGFNMSKGMATIGGHQIGGMMAARVKGLRQTRLARGAAGRAAGMGAGAMRAATRVSPRRAVAGTGRFLQKGRVPGSKLLGRGIERTAESRIAKGIGGVAGKPFGAAMRTGAERLDVASEEFKGKDRERRTKRIDLHAQQLLQKKKDIENKGLSKNEEDRRIAALAAGFAQDTKNSTSVEEKMARIAALNKANLTPNAEKGLRAKNLDVDDGTLSEWSGVSEAQVAKELKEIDRKLWENFILKRIHRLDEVIPVGKGEDPADYEDRLTREQERLGRSRDFTSEIFADLPPSVHKNKEFAEKMAPYMTMDKLTALPPHLQTEHVGHWNSLLSRAALSDDPLGGFEKIRDINPSFIDAVKGNPTFNSGIKLPEEIIGRSREGYNKLRNSATEDWTGSFFQTTQVSVDALKSSVEGLLEKQDGDINRLTKSQAAALNKLTERQIDTQGLATDVRNKLVENSTLSTEQWKALVKTMQRSQWEPPGPPPGAPPPAGAPPAASPPPPPPSPLATPGSPEFTETERGIRERT